MIDLINKKVDSLINENIDSIQSIVNKYVSVLELVKIKEEIPYLAFIIDKCIIYLNEKYPELHKDWKSWSIIVVKRQYEEKKLTKESEIIPLIDEFIEFWKSDYEKYCDDIIAVNEYERDRGFVFKFILKKNR